MDNMINNDNIDNIVNTEAKTGVKVTFRQRIYAFIKQAGERFSLQDVYSYLDISINNIRDRDNVRVTLHNLCNAKTERLIESDRMHTGWYRKIYDQMEEMDLVHAVEHPGLGIRFPFGIERVFKSLPRSIFLIAGSPNSGKTAYALNFCLLNQWKHHVVYFSSEMGASRLKGRLNKHPDFIREGIGFQAFERSDHFADAIRKFPDSICVVDYLEIYENFYEIGQKLRDIFDATEGDGCALVLVQKNPSRKNLKGQHEYVDLGRGGGFGLEKASLYLAMDSAGDDGYSRMKIVKAKEWADENVNPNNMEWQYKLLSGCRFVNIKNPIGMPSEIIEVGMSF